MDLTRHLLLDTSVLIQPTVLPDDALVAISAASLAELHYGVLVARDEDERAARLQRLAQIESTFTALPMDARVARTYGALAARLAAGGRKPRGRAFDLVIAATAAAYGASLVTRNVDDFAKLDGLVEVIPAS